MHQDHSKQENKFYSSIKNWWVILFSIGLIALFVFSLAFLIQHYQSRNLWTISSTIFAFLGVMLTAGAAIPAISAIFSYINFAEKNAQAEKDLEKIKIDLQNYQTELDKISTLGGYIHKYLKEKEIESTFLAYIKNPITEYKNEVREKIHLNFNSHYLHLISQAVQSLLDYDDYCEQGYLSDENPALECQINLIDDYRKLAFYDLFFANRYFEHLEKMIEHFISKNSETDNEYQDYFLGFVTDWIVELIQFDEKQRRIVIPQSLMSLITKLYKEHFSNNGELKQKIFKLVNPYNERTSKLSFKLNFTKPKTNPFNQTSIKYRSKE